MIKIYGFPRSGNNLLAKYVADTFYPDRDTAVHNIRWGHWSNTQHVAVNPYGKCLGGHSEFKDNAIYVVRDPLAVAYSIWRTPGFTHKDYSGTFSEFLRQPLDWRFSPGLRHYGGMTVVEHHQEYLKLSNLGYWVDYGSLVEFPEHVMTLISHWTDEPIKDFKRINEPVGYNPNWGKDMNVTSEDIQFVNNIVHSAHERVRPS